MTAYDGRSPDERAHDRRIRVERVCLAVVMLALLAAVDWRYGAGAAAVALTIAAAFRWAPPLRRRRIDTVAHPSGEPPQAGAWVLTGRPARGANTRNLRGAAPVPAGWTLLGHGACPPDVYPALLLEEGGAPMPRLAYGSVVPVRVRR